MHLLRIRSSKLIRLVTEISELLPDRGFKLIALRLEFVDLILY